MGTDVKFKVGDRVRCVDSGGFDLGHQFTVGEVYTVCDVTNTGKEQVYHFREVCGGWTIPKFELVRTAPTLTGGSSSYYKLPPKAEDLQDLIEHKKMSFAMANIFKASYRFGDKPGVTQKYDLEKIIYFAKRELQRLDKGTHNAD